MADPRGYSNEADAIAISIGNSPLWWEQSGYPSPSPHWQHGWDDACAICKAGFAPWALRVLIDRIINEHDALAHAAQVPGAADGTARNAETP